MIVRKRPGLLRLFFILRGSVMQRIYPQVLVVMAISALVVWGHGIRPGLVPTFNGAPFALLGIALSVFLGFSNNACYDRWWEGRKQWGALIEMSRNLGRQTLLLDHYGIEGQAARRELLGRAIAFAFALVVHLRDGASRSALDRTLPDDLKAAFAASRNPPELILRDMGGRLARLKAGGTISDIEFGIFDHTLARMTDIMTACERIRTTPVPFGYTLLLHRTAYLFCFLLPFGFADVLGWGTPFAAALVAYTFFGLDAIGDELEEPFGAYPNDLPLDAMARIIEINLREALGETDLPPLPAPVDYLLT